MNPKTALITLSGLAESIACEPTQTAIEARDGILAASHAARRRVLAGIPARLIRLLVRAAAAEARRGHAARDARERFLSGRGVR